VTSRLPLEVEHVKDGDLEYDTGSTLTMLHQHSQTKSSALAVIEFYPIAILPVSFFAMYYKQLLIFGS